MNLTLGDFRNILGKVNDGDVVFTRTNGEETGIEKANYGRLFKRNFKVPSAEDNARIRRLFAQAIREASSQYDPRLSAETLNKIRVRLGIVEGAAPQNDIINTPLNRHEVKAILEIVDNSSELMKVDDEILDKMNAGVDTEKRAQFSAAINSSPILSGNNNLKSVFGREFQGFSRSDIAICVKKNLAVIKAMTLDEMTWHYESTGNELTVNEAFKAAVTKIMTNFAKGEPPLTRTRQIFAAAPAPVPFDDNEHNAEQFFAANNLLPDVDLNSLLTDDLQEGTDKFSKLILSRAKDYIINTLRDDFQECISANNNSAQQAQASYDARTLGIRMEIKEFANDLRNITSQDKANLAKFRKDLVKNIVETFGGVDPATFGAKYFRSVFLWALRKAAEPFSMRALAQKFAAGSLYQDFANADFKAAFVNDFNKRVAAMPKESAFKANIEHWQAQAFNAVRSGNPVPDISEHLKHGALEYLYREFKKAREESDPVLLRQKRETRNREAAIRVMRALDSDAKVNGYSQKMLNNEVVRIQERFYTCVHGLTSLNTAKMDKLPKEERRAIVEDWIATASDDEIAFLEKFCSIHLDYSDDDLQREYKRCTGNHPEKPPLYAAFRDAGNIFKDMTKDAAYAISTIFRNGLLTLSKGNDNSLKFMNIMNGMVGQDKTVANCLDFMEKLEREINSYTGKTNQLLSAAQKTALQKQNAPRALEELFAGTKFFEVNGFGTNDPLKIIKFLDMAGISLKDLSLEPRGKWSDTCVRLLGLMHFAKANNYNLDSLPEFIQRVTGKDVKAVSFSDYLRFNATKANQRDVVKAGFEDVVNIVTGKVKLSEAKLSKKEVGDLRNAFSALRQPNAAPVAVTLKGKAITLSMLPDGGVRASVKISDKAGDVKFYRMAQHALDISRAIDDIIVANAKDYAKDVVRSVLPPLPNPAQGDSLMRAREVYAKTICAFHPTKQVGNHVVLRSPVDYASVPTVQLRQLALDAINAQALPAVNAAPQTFNSAEMIEMHKALGNITLAELDAKVKLPANEAKRTDEYRRNVPPSPKEFRAIIADLLLNEDTWAFDAQVGAAKGDRIRKLMLANSFELNFVLADIDHFILNIDEPIRAAVKEILEKLKGIPAESLKADAQHNVAPDTMQKLAEAESLVDELVKSYADSMQQKVTKLFDVKEAEGPEKPLQYQTFAEISGISALNPKTTEGKFTINVLKSYFSNSARVDQRAMLAAMIRNTDNKSTDAKQVAELLKGAGPLLQKMLQGLPISSFNPETQLALKDMKSRLAPIPDEAVKAQLLELVNSSNGEILSIDVKKVLGAATVGEALLCHVKTKDCPVTGVECVIKVLRPNIYTAALREKAILDNIIQTTAPAMQKSFDQHYNEILKEFDLTIEAENIRLGRTHYEHPTIDNKVNVEINSMDLVSNVSPATGTLVVKKVRGVTYDRYIDDIHAEANSTVAPLAPKAIEENGRVLRPCASMKEFLAIRRRLEYLKAFLGEKRNHISDFASTWFENGIYGDGFMHGDLHAGNIMISDNGATVIDFGNCIRMSKSEQEKIRTLLSKASTGFGEDAVKTIITLLDDAAQKTLTTILENKANDPHNAAFKNDLYGVFSKGTAADVMARIYAAMNLIQREGVEIPGTVSNFFQSFSRLNDIYQTMTDEMEHIDALIDTLVLGETAKPKMEGEPPQLVKNFMSFVGSLSADPYKEFNFKKFVTTANKFVRDNFMMMKDEKGHVYGGKPNVGSAYDAESTEEMVDILSNDRERALKTIVPFAEWVGTVSVPPDVISFLRLGPENIADGFFQGTGSREIKNAIVVIKDAKIATNSKAYKQAVKDLVAGLKYALSRHARDFASIMDPTPRTTDKETGLIGVNAALDRPLNMVCGKVVTTKMANFRAILGQLWTFISDFNGRLDKLSAALRENIRFSGKFETRRDYAQSILEKNNATLGHNLRLTTAKRRILMRQMEAFAWPFDGAWSETLVKRPDDEVKKVQVEFPQVKWPKFLEALTENFDSLKTALRFDADTKLPTEIAKLAVTYLAQIDPRVSNAVKSLSDQAYTQFLASFGNDPNADILGAAVGALRQAPGDAELLAARTGARAEFEEIDQEADQIDISWDKVMKLASKIGNLFGGNDDE